MFEINHHCPSPEFEAGLSFLEQADRLAEMEMREVACELGALQEKFRVALEASQEAREALELAQMAQGQGLAYWLDMDARSSQPRIQKSMEVLWERYRLISHGGVDRDNRSASYSCGSQALKPEAVALALAVQEMWPALESMGIARLSISCLGSKTVELSVSKQEGSPLLIQSLIHEPSWSSAQPNPSELPAGSLEQACESFCKACSEYTDDFIEIDESY